MRRIALLFGFILLPGLAFAQTEATTISLAEANGASTTWDGAVNIYRDASGNIVFQDLNAGTVELRNLMTATGTTTFTTAAGSTITLTDRLGVGTTTPTEVVEVVGSENGAISLLVQNTALSSYSQAAVAVRNGTASGAIGAFHPDYDNGDKPGWEDSVDVYISTQTASLGFVAQGATSFLRFMTGGVDWGINERMRIDSDGYVGIGTTAPAYGLNIVGDDLAHGTIRLERDTSGTEGPYVALLCDTTNTNWTGATISTGYLVFMTENSSGTEKNTAYIRGVVTDRTTGAIDSSLWFYTSDNGTVAPRVNVNGYGLGIGAVSAGNELEVTAATDPTINLYDTTNAAYETDVLQSDDKFVISREGTGGNDLTLDANGDFGIGLQGYVGIGKSNPATALDVSGTVTATAFVGDGAGLTGLAGASRWLEIATANYTTTPTSTSELAMSSTANIAKGRPLRYTIGGTAYYGVVVNLSASTSITVSGAPLSGNVTKLEVGQPEMVVPLTFFVAGYYADATEASLLASDLNYYHYWQQGAARLVAMRAVHSADDATTAPLAEITIGGTAGILTQSVTTVFPTITTPIVSVNTSTYDVQPGEAIEIKSTKNGTGDAANLSITGLFVLE